VNCPGGSLAPDARERITRQLVDKLHHVLGPQRDIPAPDVNTNAQTMAWMMDEYGKLHGYTPAIVTGKPISLEGSQGREAATGRGCIYMLQEAASDAGVELDGARVVVQGFGNVGNWAARIAHDSGARIVGVSDASGAVQSEAGIDPHALYAHLGDGGTLTEFDGQGVEAIDPDDLIGLECDVFIPAAMGGMIHNANADQVKAKLIVEGANAPTTPDANDILLDKGITVIPDVMANAGGVVVSYFEWVQNLQHFRWEEDEVNEKLEKIMRRSYREVAERAKEKDLPLRPAAYELGIERVFEAAATRGYVHAS
jgi:glutamate dehydrogenase (NAD(P)+)